MVGTARKSAPLPTLVSPSHPLGGDRRHLLLALGHGARSLAQFRENLRHPFGHEQIDGEIGSGEGGPFSLLREGPQPVPGTPHLWKGGSVFLPAPLPPGAPAD